MNTTRLSLALLAAATICGCSSDSDPTDTSTASQALTEGQSLYLRCNSTTFELTPDNQLQPGGDIYTFTLDVDITEEWMVTSGETCVLTLVEEEGSGTTQQDYGIRQTDIVVPDYAQLSSTSGQFRVQYPELGSYTFSVDWRMGTLGVYPVEEVVDAWLPDTESAVTAMALGYGQGAGSISSGWQGVTWVGYANGDLYFSLNADDAAPTWHEVDPSATWGGMVTAIAIDPIDSKKVVIARAGTTQGTKVFRTVNGGQSIQDVGSYQGSTGCPVEPMGLSFNPVMPGIVYAVGRSGLATSEDWGATWTAGGVAGDPLQPSSAVGTVSAVSLFNDDIDNFWVGTTEGEVYLTVNGGASFSQVPTFSAPARAISKFAAPAWTMNPPYVYVSYVGLGTGSDSLWVTGNPGSAYANIHNADLPSWGSGLAESLTGINVSPFDINTLYVGYSNQGYVSRNGGTTWVLE